MASPERSFVAAALVTTLAVPGLLLALRPFAEDRSELGVTVGWGLALAAVVPSFFVMARAFASENNLRFQRAFMVSTMGRFVLGIVGVGLFATLVDQPPLWTFVLTFFLGYVVLSALELVLLLKKSPGSSHA